MELEFARLQKLNELQAAIGYKFKDTELLNTALTHTSYVKGDDCRPQAVEDAPDRTDIRLM